MPTPAAINRDSMLLQEDFGLGEVSVKPKTPWDAYWHNTAALFTYEPQTQEYLYQ